MADTTVLRQIGVIVDAHQSRDGTTVSDLTEARQRRVTFAEAIDERVG